MEQSEITQFLNKQIEYHTNYAETCKQLGIANTTNLKYLEHEIRLQVFQEMKEFFAEKKEEPQRSQLIR